MWDNHAIKDIENGYTNIDGVRYSIISNKHGSCDGCYFHKVRENKVLNCPQKALDICCSGGNILIKK